MSAGARPARRSARRSGPRSGSSGGRPVSSSYITAPRLKMSLRASPGSPLICSGAVYPGVPNAGPRRPALAPTGPTCAMPKSRTLTRPPGVTAMLDGLRSRCTTPASCAEASASASCMPMSTAGSNRHRATAQACRQRLALDVLHHDMELPLVVEHVVDGRDIGMVQARGGARLALELRVRLGRRGGGRRPLERDAASEPRVLGQPYLAHAARAEQRDDLIRAEPMAREHGGAGRIAIRAQVFKPRRSRTWHDPSGSSLRHRHGTSDWVERGDGRPCRSRRQPAMSVTSSP